MKRKKFSQKRMPYIEAVYNYTKENDTMLVGPQNPAVEAIKVIEK